ncbi:hypothetical protein BGW36DRAFT_430645 [Talaromyces proteolyticus]|uniref:Zn(2)-C6 fungal-type domain-containing protein n=1 Tax=Talaromyces proteolyticus TaxID=1131652 RepID=A0AAD4KJH0_9EURO|nr:uncharacterized protein BGW36DRAFT_430645 [Talaromyces proteolyticus]KAH8692900.1 hypothetical protein BGW36DRAFT_430645 [Talaromyces proteolyticus]
MNPTRQERKSCEACRARKLRCSGEKSGCSRCRGLSLPCRFKDKGAPGRPRKRPRQEQPDQDLPSPNSWDFSSVVPQAALDSQEAAINTTTATLMEGPLPCELSGSCGFDAFDWDSLGNGDIRSFPIELWQQNGLQHDLDTAPVAVEDAYVSPISFSQSCKCDEEVSGLVRNLSRADMSHDIIQMFRTGVSLADRLLTCPICYDVSKPPRVTVQNVLLIGHLMFEITSGYLKYLHWLNKHCTELDVRNERETVYLQDSRLGISSDLHLQITGEKFKELVMHGLQSDAERLLVLGKKFAQRQRNRHLVGHEACPDPEGRCRKKEYGGDHDPLDFCPQNPVARKMIPCFRIVDEVRGMIKEVADAVV